MALDLPLPLGLPETVVTAGIVGGGGRIERRDMLLSTGKEEDSYLFWDLRKNPWILFPWYTLSGR